jgi:predicted DsbA family dithiol-disulfide isomerase
MTRRIGMYGKRLGLTIAVFSDLVSFACLVLTRRLVKGIKSLKETLQLIFQAIHHAEDIADLVRTIHPRRRWQIDARRHVG